MDTKEVTFEIHCPRCGDSKFIDPVHLSATNIVPDSLKGKDIPEGMVFVATKHSGYYKCATCGFIQSLDDITRSFEKQINDGVEKEAE